MPWYRHEPYNYPDGHIPLWVKATPWFWFRNEEDPLPPQWYLPDAHPSARWTYWSMRNCFHNIGYYIAGTADRASWRHGPHPDKDWSPTGRLNWAVSFLYGWFPAPFVSYRGRYVEWYIGWQWQGDLGAALRRSHS